MCDDRPAKKTDVAKLIKLVHVVAIYQIQRATLPYVFSVWKDQYHQSETWKSYEVSHEGGKYSAVNNVERHLHIKLFFSNIQGLTQGKSQVAVNIVSNQSQ